jgi:hypothetical protein
METDHGIGEASGERRRLGFAPFRRHFKIAIFAPGLLKKRRASQEDGRKNEEEDKRYVKKHGPT